MSKAFPSGDLSGSPGILARDFEGQGRDAGRTVYLLDPMRVRDLASALGLKPFAVVADLMELKQFKTPDDAVGFDLACLVARKRGYRPEKPPPGMLIL
jgi:hypothetical protein